MNEFVLNLEEQFNSMFQFAPIGIAFTNQEGFFIHSNPELEKLFGYTSEEFKKLQIHELTSPNNRLLSSNLFKPLSSEQKYLNSIQQFHQKNGDIFFGNLSANVVQDANGLIRYVLVIIQRVSEKERGELPLQDANPQLKNQVTEPTADFSQEDVTERQTIQKILKIQKEFLHILINLYPNTILTQGSFAIVTNANTLEAMESELQQTKEQLRAVLDAMPGFVCWINSEGKYLGVNQYMADTFNISTDSFVGQELCFLKNSPEFTQFMIQFLVDSAPTGHHVVEAQVNGSTRHYLIAAQKYHQDSLAVSVGIDITDRKLAEAQIQASLQEKEVLLQEIHHRVKNNLQVVSSLLDLQSQQIEDSLMLEVFRESQNRVKSMALVHEKLYQSKNFAKINFAEYTESLVNYLFKAYELHSGNVILELDIDEVALNIDTAIPCGLIINELLSNALKYAFPENRSGKISISLHSQHHQHFTLTIKDDGVGLPMDWDFKTVKSLGLQLVKVLTKQLKGTIEIDRSRGSQFRLDFSEVRRSES